MDERYHTVEEAADVTFKWLYAEPSNQTSSNPRFHYPFREWLASGDGIFHISGKPGSGKSTLMKFICNHPQTKRELGKWSGKKTLVFASFFFWKPGSSMQKSLLGLVRSLLYRVLYQCPESIQDIFPQYWDNSQYSHWSTPPAIHIENKEIFDGFHGLLQNTKVFENHRFCFFVDGLDEFQEAFRTYPDLVASLHDWVKVSCGHLKLCVSSRELPTFLDGFAVDQRIRLQDLTIGDIHSLAQQSLTQSKHFLNMQKEVPAKSLDLITKITDKSDGVFLWVILTLKTLREGLESRDSLDEIFRKLDAIPQELEEFFSFIMESVPNANREKAYCSLAYALEISKSAVSFSARRSDSSFDVRFATRNIFRWSFINDYVNNKDFANHLAFRCLSDEEIEKRLDTTVAQIQDRCKGLLELSARKGRINSVSTYVAFMHRSIPEFLEDYLTTDPVQKYIRHFDFGDALIQTFLAVAKSVEFTDLCRFHNLTLWDELKFLVNFIRLSDGTDQSLYFSKLDNLDEVLLRRYGEVYPDFRSSGWKNYYSTYWDHPSLLTPLSTASHEFFYEYIVWKLQRRPQLIKATQGTQIAQAILDGCFSANGKISSVALERSLTSLRTIFKLGVEPSQVTDHVAYESMTLWELLLQRSCYYESSAHVWGAIRVMLENGADIPTWEHKKLDEYTFIELQVGERRHVLKERNTGGCGLRFTPRELKEVGGTATLKDLMDTHHIASQEILQLLVREEKVNQVPEKVVELEDSHVTPEPLLSKESDSSSSSFLANSIKSSNMVDLLLINPALPWTIVGGSSSSSQLIKNPLLQWTWLIVVGLVSIALFLKTRR